MIQKIQLIIQITGDNLIFNLNRNTIMKEIKK